MQQQCSPCGRSSSSNSVSSIEVARDAVSALGSNLERSFTSATGGKEEVLAGLWSPNDGWVKVVRPDSVRINAWASAQSSGVGTELVRLGRAGCVELGR